MGKQELIDKLPTFESFEDEAGASLLDQLEIEKPPEKPAEKTPEEIAAAEAVEKEAKEAVEAKKLEDKEAAAEAKKLEEEEATAKLEEEEEAEKARIEALEDDDPEKIKAEKEATKAKEKKDKEEADEGTFWGDVEKITGRQVEVDFGDVEPDSPEGAALREDAVAQHAINDQLDHLSRMYPKEFRALEHASRGGSIDDLYTPGEPDYSKMTISEDDAEFQKSFMRNYYVKKGFTETRAIRLVESDEDAEDGLFKASTEALKELSSTQEKEQVSIIEKQKRDSETSRQEDLQIIGSVEQIVQAGKLNKFTVPTKEREDFYQYALSRIQRNPQGGYMFVTPVQGQQLEQQLQEMYFAYKRGDLSTIIQREATTTNAKKLQRNISKEKSKPSVSSGAAPRKKAGLPTMEDFEE